MYKFLKFIVLFFSIGVLFSNIAFAQDEIESEPNFDYHRDFKNILERTQNKYDSLYYPNLLMRFVDNDPTLRPDETLALMIGYTKSKYYKPYEDMQAELELIKLNDKAFYLDAVDDTKAFLRTHPLSLSINKERSYAYYMLKKKDSAKYFMQLADKIMEAMIYSGKGRTAENAFFSLGLVDGDYFVPNVGLSIWGKGTGKDKHHNYMYTIDAVDLKDVHRTFYFNIEHAKSKMDKDEADSKAVAVKKPKKTKGKQPLVDTIPFNPADSIVLPFNERPIIIDSAKIKDSIRISDSLRMDSIRLDSLRILDSLRADSARWAQADSIQKANLKSDTATSSQHADINHTESVQQKSDSIISTDTITPPHLVQEIEIKDSLPQRVVPPPSEIEHPEMDRTPPLISTDQFQKIDSAPQTEPVSPASLNNPIQQLSNDSITEQHSNESIPVQQQPVLSELTTDSSSTIRLADTLPNQDSVIASGNILDTLPADASKLQSIPLNESSSTPSKEEENNPASSMPSGNPVDAEPAKQQ